VWSPCRELVDNTCTAAVAGVVRGAGRQTIGAITNFISYWMLGLPLAALLAFRFHLGIHGLWGGLLVGCFDSMPFAVTLA
jgi:multidrug resistance protein, MATE family